MQRIEANSCTFSAAGSLTHSIGAAEIIANSEGEERNLSRPKTLSYTTNINLFHKTIYINCLQHPTDDTPYMIEKIALAYFHYSLEY